MPSETLSWVIEQHDQVASTQTLAKETAENGAESGFVIQALEQVQGYGRHGRHWVSDRGNISLSIILRPNKTLSDLHQLSFVVSLAVYDTFSHYIEAERMVLKWPNDVLIDGRKAAGILLEADTGQSGCVNWVIAGIGINIANKPMEDACCLSEFIDDLPALDVFRDQFLDALKQRYDQWMSEGFDFVCENWLECGMKIGTEITVKHGKEHKSGSYQGVDAQGNLILQQPSGAQNIISAGDVHFAAQITKGAA